MNQSKLERFAGLLQIDVLRTFDVAGSMDSHRQHRLLNSRRWVHRKGKIWSGRLGCCFLRSTEVGLVNHESCCLDHALR